MLACAGLGDDGCLAHRLGKQGLAEAVVDLVGASVVKIFALEVNLSACQERGPGYLRRRVRRVLATVWREECIDYAPPSFSLMFLQW